MNRSVASLVLAVACQWVLGTAARGDRSVGEARWIKIEQTGSHDKPIWPLVIAPSVRDFPPMGEDKVADKLVLKIVLTEGQFGKAMAYVTGQATDFGRLPDGSSGSFDAFRISAEGARSLNYVVAGQASCSYFLRLRDVALGSSAEDLVRGIDVLLGRIGCGRQRRPKANQDALKPANMTLQLPVVLPRFARADARS